MDSWNVDGDSEGDSYCLNYGQSWNFGEEIYKNYYGCWVALSFWVYDVLCVWVAAASFLLLIVGKFGIINAFVKILETIKFQLFDVVYREETLLNVIRSVTRNGRSIILTAVLAIILVYMFSIIGYIFFKDDFLVPVDEDLVGEGGFNLKSEI